MILGLLITIAWMKFWDFVVPSFMFNGFISILTLDSDIEHAYLCYVFVYSLLYNRILRI